MAHRRVTVASKVSADVAEAVRATAEDHGEMVSDLIREYVEAVAGGRRWHLVDANDELVGWAFVLGDGSVSREGGVEKRGR
jgi:hypothetical protein